MRTSNVGSRGRWRTLGFFLVCASILGGGGWAQTLQTKDELARLNYATKGPDLFRSYCAPCHGAVGKGDGPVAPALKVRVPDLTVLSKGNQGSFPAARTRKIVMGDEVIASHGSRDMPVWGPVFHETEKEQGLPKNTKVENLLQYLESIQQK